MVSIEKDALKNKWYVKFKGKTIDTTDSRVAALRRAFVICELAEDGYFDGLSDEEFTLPNVRTL